MVVFSHYTPVSVVSAGGKYYYHKNSLCLDYMDVKMSLNILVLGTSNSLLKGGWVDGLKAAMPDCTIRNLSIGASPGIQFSSLLNIDFSLYDYVFFDSVPNDEEYQYFTQGYSDIEFSTRILYEIFSTISSEARLVVLGICNKVYLSQESQVYSLRRSLAAACGAEFVDVRYLLNNNADFFKKTARADLYDFHPSHPLPHHMFFIGSSIGSCLLNMPCVDKLPGKSYRDGYTVLRVSSMNFAGLNLVERSNSLLSESFALLVENDYLEFNAGGKCIGFYVNYRGTNAAICFFDTSLVEVFHVNLFADVDDRLMKIFVPIPNGIEVSRVSVRKKPVSGSYTPMMFKEIDNDRSPTVMQISHVVFCSSSNESLCDVDLFSVDAQISESPLMAMVSGMIEKTAK